MPLPKLMRRFPAHIHPSGNPDLGHEPAKPFIRRPLKDVGDQAALVFAPELSVSLDFSKEAAKAVEFNNDV